MDKYEYITGEDILPSDQSRKITQTKFAYFRFEKALENQRKTIEEQGKKEAKALKVLEPNTKKLLIRDVIPENILRTETRTELNRIKEMEKMVDRENLVHRTNQYP